MKSTRRSGVERRRIERRVSIRRPDLEPVGHGTARVRDQRARLRRRDYRRSLLNRRKPSS